MTKEFGPDAEAAQSKDIGIQYQLTRWHERGFSSDFALLFHLQTPLPGAQFIPREQFTGTMDSADSTLVEASRPAEQLVGLEGGKDAQSGSFKRQRDPPNLV